MARAAMIWKGNGFYVGVPARDLSADEVKRYGREFLLSLGLYEEVEKPRAAWKPRKDDDIEEVENARN